MDQLLQIGVIPSLHKSPPHSSPSTQYETPSPRPMTSSSAPDQAMTSHYATRAGPGYIERTPPHCSPDLSSEVSMAYSPYSVGSNSTSPSQTSPLPYVKTEQHVRHGMPMRPRLVILEQPQERFRFRYESELGGTHGQLAGRSGAERRSFPTVKLEGFQGKANIKCELFTVSDTGKPPVPHVHTLQGRYCANGAADFSIDHTNDYTASFQGLGIIHTARKAMLEKIKRRKLMEKTTGPHWKPTEADERQATQEANSESLEINMNRVCLRFRALVQDPENFRFRDICDPVFSDPIYNGKSAQTGELKIVQLSEAYSPCTGNKEIWLLVERVRKNDIKVRFYEEDDNKHEIWHAYGKVSKCHHQYAIIFQTPAYHNKDLRGSVRVWVQLERPSDGCVSEPKNFQYTERDQRATKRLGIQQETAEHKRSRTVDEGTGNTWPFYLPQAPEIRGLLRELEDDPTYRQFLDAQQQQQQHQQYVPPTQQPQQIAPQQQQQQQHSFFGEPINYPAVTSYPSYQALAPALSPAMAQQPMYSPPMQPQANQPANQLLSRDPCLARPQASVDDIMGGQIPLTVPHVASPPRATGPGLNTTGGHVTYGAPPFQPPAQEPDLANVHRIPGVQALDTLNTDEMLSSILNAYPNVCEDGVPITAPNAKDCAPRGVPAMRGLSCGGDSGATCDKDGALAQSMERLSLQQGGGEPPQQPQPSPAGPQTRPMDTSRPEVKLAYADAERIYLYAATGNHQVLLEHARFLMGIQNSDGDNPLHVAAMYGRSQSMAGFLQAISVMTKEDREERINGQNGNRQTPLHIAVLTQNIECIRLLLNAGAHCHLVDCGGNTVVHRAARSGQPEVLQTLLQHLQQHNTLPQMLQLTNYEGFTALHLAVRVGSTDAVQQLIAAGADVSATCDTEGRSPLHLAVEAENLDMCRLLLSLGAEVDAPTFGDVTPLHVACKQGTCQVASLLLGAGADPFRQSVERQAIAGSGTESGDDEEEDEDSDGASQLLDAFLYAELSGNTQLEQILHNRGNPTPEGVPATVAMATSGAVVSTPQAVVPPAMVAPLVAAAGKKGGDGMDSGMDSGLGLTSEMMSGMTSSCDSGSVDVLPDPVAWRLATLLDSGAWRDVADLLQLDISSLQQQASPTAHILRCVKKYDNMTLELLAGVLESLGQTEAQALVKNAIGQ